MRATCSSVPKALSSASCDGETMAATAAPSAASVASVAATAANSSRGRGAAACIVFGGAPARASRAPAGASSGGRSDWGVDATGVASSGKVCGSTGSVCVWRHHTSRLGALAPRVAEDQDQALAEDHFLIHRLARPPNQILRCDKSELPRPHAGSTLHLSLFHHRRRRRRRKRRTLDLLLNHHLRLLLPLLLDLHRRLLLPPAVHPRLREEKEDEEEQTLSNLLNVEHGAGGQGVHTWYHASNRPVKGCRSKGAPLWWAGR